MVPARKEGSMQHDHQHTLEVDREQAEALLSANRGFDAYDRVHVGYDVRERDEACYARLDAVGSRACRCSRCLRQQHGDGA
jgi:hypothetical protein